MNTIIKKINLVFIFVFFFINSIVAQELKLVYVDIQHPSRDVKVFVNEVPVGESSAEKPSYVLRVSSFLKEGPNQITLRWKAVEKPSFPMKIEVLESKQGAPRKDATKLVDYQHDKNENVNSWIEKTFTFSIHSPYNWSWEKAESVQKLTDKDHAQILSKVRTLHTALSSKNMDKVWEMISLLLYETYLKNSELSQRVKASYQKMMENPNWSLKEPIWQQLKVHAFGKLVMVSGPTPVILTDELSGSRQFKMEKLFFSKLNGTWELVRFR